MAITRHTTDAPATTTRRGPASRSDSTRPGGRTTGASVGISHLRNAISKHQESKSVGAYNVYKYGAQSDIAAILQADTFVSYFYHWVKGAEGRKSFLCLKDESNEAFIGRDPDDDRQCPLCKAGDKRIFKTFFNITVLPDNPDDELEVYVLECGITLATQIINYGESERIKEQGGLNGPGIYWELGRTSTGTGDKTKYTFSFAPVKGRDLMDDWGLTEPAPEQLVALEDSLYGLEIVRRDDYETLAGLVDTLYGK